MTGKRTWLGLVAAVLVTLALWWQQGDGTLTSDEPAPTPSASSSPTEVEPTEAEPSESEPPETTPTTQAPTLPSPSNTVTRTAEPTTAPTGEVDPVSGLPLITTTELPAEAIDTLELIAAGGPYPYEQDDSVFMNREGILPDQPEGYYREYTVETPGSDDRGARRIVAGVPGEYYWTDDHYASFSRITE